jgi:hypothetical protein
MISFKFSVTATNLNLADTTEQSLFTFHEPAHVIWVPKALTLVREAGTVYTVGDIVKRPLQKTLATTRSDAIVPTENRSLDFYLTETRSGRTTRTRLVFQAPAKELLGAKKGSSGFDSALQDDVRMVLTPVVDGQWWQEDKFIALTLVSNVSISGGTGSLLGELFFDQYAI